MPDKEIKEEILERLTIIEMEVNIVRKLLKLLKSSKGVQDD